MQRRNFLSISGTAAAASPLFPSSAEAAQQGGARKRALMKVGCQSGPLTDKQMQFFKRHGVEHICANPTDPKDLGYYTVDELKRARDVAGKWGISVDLVPMPFLSSSHVDRTKRAGIMMGTPERDKEIELVQTAIKNAAAAGIPAIKYNLTLLGVLRLPTRDKGRGGTTLSTWRFKDAKNDPPLTRAGKVNADMMWERITYFLDRVIPVANEYKIRMALHPNDPGVPPITGYQGVDCVLGTIEGMKRFITIKESPYHGFNFCQGTVSEMLQNPATEILDAIRYFGSRKKIFNVHFRNIRGKRDSFVETYPDEGDVDFVKAILAYREVGYDAMLMPDHVPHHADDPGGLQAFSFAYGHIKALIQAVDQLG